MDRSNDTSTRLIPLADAAHHLRVSYLAARDMLLRGELRGLKRDGRWFVEQASIRQMTGKDAEK